MGRWGALKWAICVENVFNEFDLKNILRDALHKKENFPCFSLPKWNLIFFCSQNVPSTYIYDWFPYRYNNSVTLTLFSIKLIVTSYEDPFIYFFSFSTISSTLIWHYEREECCVKIEWRVMCDATYFWMDGYELNVMSDVRRRRLGDKNKFTAVKIIHFRAHRTCSQIKRDENKN